MIGRSLPILFVAAALAGCTSSVPTPPALEYSPDDKAVFELLNQSGSADSSVTFGEGVVIFYASCVGSGSMTFTIGDGAGAAISCSDEVATRDSFELPADQKLAVKVTADTSTTWSLALTQS
jgi:hypothetical protein